MQEHLRRPTRYVVAVSAIAVLGASAPGTAGAETLRFSGYDWKVTFGENRGPGPNAWSAANARVDAAGALHLRITKRDGRWTCAEVALPRTLGYGTYTFEVSGPIDRLDRNVVLGLFDYPPPSVGPDGTNEIDIEFARWGRDAAPNGNYTVWPAATGVPRTSHTFRFRLASPTETTTQVFRWSADRIEFWSFADTNTRQPRRPFGHWLFQPTAPQSAIPQHPLPVLMNLWLFQGKPPADGKDVEIVIRRFSFTPAGSEKSPERRVDFPDLRSISW